MSAKPEFSIDRSGGETRMRLGGSWTLDAGADMERSSERLVGAAAGGQAAVIDIGGVERMDTGGAWLIDRARTTLETAGVSSSIVNARPDQAILLQEAGWRAFDAPKKSSGLSLVDMLVDLGESVANAGGDFVAGVAFLGASVVGLGRAFAHPLRFRFTSLVYHLESFGLRSVPIILLINFLVGCIVAQQGIFQLRYFGAEAFAVDLIGILILRELGVLLTSIMIAGRSGSAITAEIGSMKMREEIDALTVMGLSPMDVLVIPRLIALIIAMPLLTFLADMAAIFGGMLVSWIYAGLGPEAFLTRLQNAIAMNTFLVGLIKAPFMALVIALVGAMEGMRVEGSAESLGRQVTASVVKAIFMVIVVDGLFAMFFATIEY
ncbi:MAG: MlaE family lipid ABC transporter permease subunit [Hyphomicrobiales bacterium]|nr:MlaE family lipid ABC transporter permease subunit [Hyphomicrobiales bacterium]